MKWEPVDGTLGASVEFTMPRVIRSRLASFLPFFERVDMNASHPDSWDFLAECVRHPWVKTVVEAGTYMGHGTFAMAESLRLRGGEGHIWTADVTDFGVVDAFQRLQLSERVSWCHGRFEDMLTHIVDPIDFAFIDASQDGDPRMRVDYLDLVLPRLSPYGLVVVDDCLDSPENLWPEAKELRERCDVYLPLGNGLTIFQR